MRIDDAVEAFAVADVVGSNSHARRIWDRLCDHVGVNDQPPGGSGPVLNQSAETFCYNHTKTPTRLRCTRCNRPICGRCAIPASVGQHCPECVAEARRSAPRVRSAVRAAAPAVTVILAINVVSFIAQRVIPGFTESLLLFEPAIAHGEWWRLLSPMVLHANITHIAFNSFALWIYGPDAEQSYGTLRFVVIYLVAGFAGSAASYSFGPCPQPSLGASGAIFGVIGALLIYVYRRRTSAVMYSYMRGIAGIIVLNLVIGFVFSGLIDNFAHIGGLVGGAAVGAGLDKDRGPSRSLATQLAVAAAVVGLATATIVLRTGALEATCPGVG